MRRRCVGTFVLGLLAAAPVSGQERRATPPSQISVRDGFQVSLLRSAAQGEGSWISMTFDHKGRIIVARDRAGLARITLHKDRKSSYELLKNSLKHCRGVLYAHGSLYVNATHSKKFYRLRDTNGDDQFDERTLLKAFDYRSRYGHGQNQIVAGPDGMLYLVHGNDVSFPEGFAPDSPYRNPRNDWLLPNPRDEGQDNRVGYILRTDPDGTKWEVVAGGLRNQVDLAFNQDGEMFTWDADMEWDLGQPWYRPTRVNHIVSGGEYGWRWGTGKWPEWYTDSLPSNLDTGLASPTGLAFGHPSRFPPVYRKVLFMADWQNGRILAATPQEVGASYRFTYESFLEGGALNVSDLAFGKDGALYFITGGRGSQSGLYRVSWKGEEIAPPLPDKSTDKHAAAAARKLRRQLERHHVRHHPGAVAEIWLHLGSDDPWIRFAARVALENQPLETWREQALTESHSRKAIAALLALARAGNPSDAPRWYGSFLRLDHRKMTYRDLVEALRTLQLGLIRLGRPGDKAAEAKLTGWIAEVQPYNRRRAARLLLELQVFFDLAPTTERALARLAEAPTQEEQVQIVRTLLHRKSKFTSGPAGRILSWFERARSYRGGHLFRSTMKALLEDYLKKLDDKAREDHAVLIARLQQPTPPPQATAGERKFVKAWSLASFAADFDNSLQRRSYESGHRAAGQANCLLCHRVGEEGGYMGPDLSAVGGRFDTRTLLESMINPSAVISPKYRLTEFRLKDGRKLSGWIIGVSGKSLRLETSFLTQETIEVPRSDIVSQKTSKHSPMPPALLNTLKRDEVLDLLAYLKAGGNPEHPIYQHPGK